MILSSHITSKHISSHISRKQGLLDAALRQRAFIDASAVVTDRPVQQGWCLDLDGTDGFVNLGGSGGEMPLQRTDTLDYSCYFRREGTGQQFIVGNFLNGGDYGGWSIRYSADDGGTIVLSLGGVGNLLKCSCPAPAVNVWSRLRITYDGSSAVSGVAMFIGGVAQTITNISDNLSGAISYGASVTMAIGGWVSSNSPVNSMWDGQLAGIQISGTYNLQYNLDFQVGTTVYDSSGNDNHGTLATGATSIADNTIPPEIDFSNLLGYSKAQILASSGGTGWGESGAVSDQSAVGDFELHFTVTETNKHRFVGVDTSPSSTALHTELGHAIYLQDDSNVRVWESGVAKSSLFAYATNDKLTIKRVGTQVTYYLNDVLIYTSLNSLSGEVWTNVVFFSSTESIGVSWLNGEYITWGETEEATTSEVLIPRDESDPTKDIFGNDLQYTGSVYPVPPVKRNSYCGVFDGIDDFISAPHLSGSETVISGGGTSTPSVSAGRIDFTAGTCWDLILSDGTHYIFSEGYDVVVFDVSGNGNHATVSNVATGTLGAGFWGGRQDLFHWNLDNGFSLDEGSGLRVPALSDGSGLNSLTSQVLTNPPVTAGSNGAETELDIYNIAEGDNPCPASNNHSAYSAITFDQTHDDLTDDDAPVNSVFRQDISPTAKGHFLAYTESLTGDDLQKLETYTT